MNTIRICLLRSLSFILISTLLLAQLTGCLSKSHDPHHSKMKVTSPLRTDKDLTREYVGQVRAIQHIEIRAFERGYLQEIFVDEGQLVKKGEKMFEIMPTLNRAEFNKSKAEMDLAQIEYKNTKSLADQNVVSINELALVKAKLDKAKADLALAQAHLDFTLVKAPFEGLMDRFHVRLGSLVEEGELLTTLSDNSRMWVYFNVSESDYLDYKTHEEEVNAVPVRLRMANGKIFEQTGKIDTIEADFNSDTGNIAFRASFENPKGLLRHGETGSVMVTLPVQNALVIPQKATFEILDKKFVFVIDEKNKLQTREVVIGQEMPHLFIISSGLKENDKFLLEGIGKVRAGTQIEPEFEEPQKVLDHLNVPVE